MKHLLIHLDNETYITLYAAKLKLQLTWEECLTQGLDLLVKHKK